MNPVAMILLASAFVIFTLDVFACYRVIRSAQLEPMQKTLQCVLIWLIPVFGAGLCIALSREPEQNQVKGYSSSGTTMNPDAVDVIFLGHGAGDYFMD